MDALKQQRISAAKTKAHKEILVRVCASCSKWQCLEEHQLDDCIKKCSLFFLDWDYEIRNRLWHILLSKSIQEPINEPWQQCWGSSHGQRHLTDSSTIKSRAGTQRSEKHLFWKTKILGTKLSLEIQLLMRSLSFLSNPVSILLLYLR